MESKNLFNTFCLGAVLAALWTTSLSAPVDTPSEHEQLKRTLHKLDQVLDGLLERKNERKWIESSNPDGPVPYRSITEAKERKQSSQEYSSNPERKWIESSNPDGPVPYRSITEVKEKKQSSRDYSSNPDGDVPYRTLKETDDKESNFKKVLRYLLDMNDKLRQKNQQERDIISTNPDGPVPYKRSQGRIR